MHSSVLLLAAVGLAGTFAQSCNFKIGVDYFGSDYKNIRQIRDENDCCSRCLADSRCRSFVFNQQTRVCYLKEKCANRMLNNVNAVSGQIDQCQGNPNPGNNDPSFAAATATYTAALQRFDTNAIVGMLLNCPQRKGTIVIGDGPAIQNDASTIYGKLSVAMGIFRQAAQGRLGGGIAQYSRSQSSAADVPAAADCVGATVAKTATGSWRFQQGMSGSYTTNWIKVGGAWKIAADVISFNKLACQQRPSN